METNICTFFIFILFLWRMCIYIHYGKIMILPSVPSLIGEYKLYGYLIFFFIYFLYIRLMHGMFMYISTHRWFGCGQQLSFKRTWGYQYTYIICLDVEWWWMAIYLKCIMFQIRIMISQNSDWTGVRDNDLYRNVCSDIHTFWKHFRLNI